MLSVKQGGIKYHFWVFIMTQPWDWTQISKAIGEHSNHYANIGIYKTYLDGAVTANWLKSQNGTLFLHVWRRGRLALDPL